MWPVDQVCGCCECHIDVIWTHTATLTYWYIILYTIHILWSRCPQLNILLLFGIIHKSTQHERRYRVWIFGLTRQARSASLQPYLGADSHWSPGVERLDTRLGAKPSWSWELCSPWTPNRGGKICSFLGIMNLFRKSESDKMGKTCERLAISLITYTWFIKTIWGLASCQPIICAAQQSYR